MTTKPPTVVPSPDWPEVQIHTGRQWGKRNRALLLHVSDVTMVTCKLWVDNLNVKKWMM